MGIGIENARKALTGIAQSFCNEGDIPAATAKEIITFINQQVSKARETERPIIQFPKGGNHGS
jgi:hypothetical protein